MPTTRLRSERIEARTSAEVLAIVRLAAEMQGRSISDFIMTAAENAAMRTISETTLVRMAADDQKRFAESIINPPTATPAMLRALQHHAQLADEQ